MAYKEEGTLTSRQERGRHAYNTFFTRYPEALNWLDGSVWVLDGETDIHEPIQNFRASMRYQASTMGLNTVTKLQWRIQDGETRRVLLLQAVPKVPDAS